MNTGQYAFLSFLSWHKNVISGQDNHCWWIMDLLWKSKIMITSRAAFNQNAICWCQKSSSLNLLRFKVTYYKLLDPGQTASIPCCNKNLAHLNWILKEKRYFPGEWNHLVILWQIWCNKQSHSWNKKCFAVFIPKQQCFSFALHICSSVPDFIVSF